ncbi:hypothetical protein [Hoeflea sp. TYP-13]|uniref:hypothetical protein n=1 Tax=Hoeflea sp. TYP-13 TaxID=3230023 RepID=UPI0034C613EC
MNILSGIAAALFRTFIVVSYAFCFFILGFCILSLIAELASLGIISISVMLILLTVFGGFVGWGMDRQDFVQMNRLAAKASLGWSLACLKFYGALFGGLIIGYQLLKLILSFNPEFGIMPGLAIWLGTPIAFVWIVFSRGHGTKPRGNMKNPQRTFDALSCGFNVGRPVAKGHANQQSTDEIRQK